MKQGLIHQTDDPLRGPCDARRAGSVFGFYHDETSVRQRQASGSGFFDNLRRAVAVVSAHPPVGSLGGEQIGGMALVPVG